MIDRSRRALAVTAGSLLLTFPLAGAAAAQTPDETGDYRGSADASVLDLTAGDAADDVADGITLLDASVAPTETEADTQNDVSFGDETGLISYGYGANISGTILDEIEGAGPVEVYQDAPPDNQEPESETLIEIPADPLLEQQTFSGEALARDVGTVACPDDNIASYGWAEVDDTRLFPEAADGEDVAHVAGVVDTRSEVSLTDIEGQDTLGVQSQATSSVSSVDLFGGQDADALTIDVLSEPTLTAVAGGTPGTAEVTWNAPVVQINGEGLDANETQEFSIPPDAEEGEDLIARIAYGTFDQTTSDDGTQASGSASVLHIEVLRAVDMGTLAEIELAPMNVEAEAPDGGVVCPAGPDEVAAPDDGLDVDVEGPDQVNPGDEFDYTIDVTNPLECPIEDLVVVSDITGPDGAEVTGTDPEGDVDGLTVTWDDLDDLDPNETITFTVTVSVPEDAETGVSFRNDVTATGSCDGDDVAGEGAFDGPTVADDTAVADDGDEADTRPAARERLPETGGGIALLGLAALGMATALRRRSA